MIVLVVLGLAAVAVLGAVVVLAMGRGGELVATHPDHPRLTLGDDGWPITQVDVAYLRLPRTLWGYQPDLTDEAVRRLARALADRDAEIDALRRENAALRLRGGESVGALYGLRESTGPNAVPSDEVPPGAGDPRDGRTAEHTDQPEHTDHPEYTDQPEYTGHTTDEEGERP